MVVKSDTDPGPTLVACMIASQNYRIEFRLHTTDSYVDVKILLMIDNQQTLQAGCNKTETTFTKKFSLILAFAYFIL